MQLQKYHVKPDGQNWPRKFSKHRESNGLGPRFEATTKTQKNAKNIVKTNSSWEKLTGQAAKFEPGVRNTKLEGRRFGIETDLNPKNFNRRGLSGEGQVMKTALTFVKPR